MKAAHYLILFFAISFILIAAATLQYSPVMKTEIHITRMEMHFSGENAMTEIDYEVGFLTEIYLLFFGSRNLNPYISQLLYDFEEYQIISVRGTTATIELLNVANYTGGYYLHNSRSLGMPVDRLILVYPDGKALTFENATETQSIFY